MMAANEYGYLACKACEGAGLCPLCDGEGFLDGETEIDCEACHGTGECPCCDEEL